jgi:hypothetical protein
MRIFKYGLASVVGAVMLSPAAQADTFRCAGQIIEQNMSQEEVVEYCGQPDETNNQTRISWTYKQQAGSQDVVVYFYNNGDVEEIETVPEQ